jgi:hypothetical protein
MDRADRTAMGSDDRLRMIRVCKRELLKMLTQRLMLMS